MRDLRSFEFLVFYRSNLFAVENLHPGHRNFFRLLFIYSLSHALFVMKVFKFADGVVRYLSGILS